MMIRFLFAIVGAAVGASTFLGPREDAEPHAIGNDACRRCHAAIADSYARTPMARTSGPAFPPLEGSFVHAPSGVAYRVLQSGGKAWLTYDRNGERPLHGRQELKYYVGSNTRGRTFLFDIDGFLYQSPINYYADAKVWDMSPGYGRLRAMELNHPVDSTCLFCHASRDQAPAKGTVNRFAGPPFLQNGVGCERCHGPGSEHASGRASMVNPRALSPDRRDDVCVQCHLEGEARIAKPTRSEEQYQPGATLSDYLAIFVRQDAGSDRRGAVSHVESLAASRCKRASGSAMSCISCHDPHVQPGVAARAAYYRAKCLRCHAPLASAHYPREPDCTSCHMPRVDSADIGHTVVTDHRILRRPEDDRPPMSVGRLVQFGAPTADARDLGLAYGEVALRGDAFAAAQALRLLEQVRRERPPDADVLTRLGYLHQARGEMDRAEQSYEDALAIDSNRGVVAANLGVFYARRGALPRAIELWRRAFENNPQLSDIGIDLGRTLCAGGDASGARDVLERVLAHNPDFEIAQQTEREIAERGCPPKGADR
jgi:hypothetical protein